MSFKDWWLDLSNPGASHKQKDNGRYVNPNCKQPSSVKKVEGVSEPVISFVRFLEEHPENFLFKLDKNTPSDLGQNYKIYDKKNKILFRFSVISNRVYVDGCTWLTREEREYLHSVWENHMIKIEKERQMKERQKYINIYCKGE